MGFMRFFNSENEIDFLSFKELAPAEATLIEPYLDAQADFVLDQKGVLSLRSPDASDEREKMSLDLHSQLEYHKRFFYKNSIYNQPLAKALGLKKGKERPIVLDATAGTLKDSCLMVSMGFKVIACERNPIAAALILNALKRCPIAELKFVFNNAVDVSKENESWDVVYFDPMYEQINKKAAARKEMRIFRDVVHADLDAKEVALKLKEMGKRIVIKRSSKAEPLVENPTMSFGSKSTIYDVFI